MPTNYSNRFSLATSPSRKPISSPSSSATLAYTLPDVIPAIEQDLRQGRSVVLSLFNTGEAQTDRKVRDARADEQLNRPVAVKVPHAKLISKSEDAEAYLAEARTVANLDHPGIVPVHDVGSTEDCPCYIVSKYIQGTDLATKVKRSCLFSEAGAASFGRIC